VTRVADGETLEGRSIPPEAYAAYLRASVLEERGDARGAVAELERALDDDPNSPEIVTRIARLLCMNGKTSQDAAEEALSTFDDALALDPTYAPAWLGLAECRERRGDLRGALDAARRAADYDPKNPRSTRAVARLLFSLGRPGEAWTWLEALTTFVPESREAWLALLDEARRRNDGARERRARRALDAQGILDERSREQTLDEALAEGNLPRARSLATELSIGPSALALRALNASAPRLALEQADLVLAVDPSDSDAWIAALAASDVLGDEAHFAETVRLLDPEPLRPSATGLAVLRALVERRADRDAAAAFDPPHRNP
jgi:Tfp pilus assembly protein PilF